MKALLNRVPKWSFKVFMVIMALIIIIFNDSFGNEDSPFIIISFFYFLLILLLTLRWLFIQIKTIINLKKEQHKAELMHLKGQVNPHFFFNMLNNLYGWIDKDPNTAKKLIISLSDMMRYSIYEGDKNTVTLEEEVVYMQKYIELHRMRYHKKIEIMFTINITEKPIYLMPLLFIILLENAFKHGVENLRENAFVHLKMEAKDEKITFEIKNNFDSKEIPVTSGIGIKNLKRRLELVYPKKHSLIFGPKNGVYTAKLILKV